MQYISYFKKKKPCNMKISARAVLSSSVQCWSVPCTVLFSVVQCRSVPRTELFSSVQFSSVLYNADQYPVQWCLVLYSADLYPCFFFFLFWQMTYFRYILLLSIQVYIENRIHHVCDMCWFYSFQGRVDHSYCHKHLRYNLLKRSHFVHSLSTNS